MTLQIRLLGGLQLVRGTEQLAFSAPAKAASLLTYLIIHRARQTLRDTIAFTLWPDDDEARARANLRRHLALIVRGLPIDAAHPPVVADNRSIGWNPQYPCTIDVVEFERLSSDAGGAAEATAHYRGDLLPAAYDEWILPERERLRALHGVNLELLTERFARAGDYTSAIATTRALLLHDPWREDAVRTLLSLRHTAGDRAGALQEFESFARRLRVELGVAPMPETVSRYESILLSNDSAVRDRPTSALERSTLPAMMPFAGRSDELLRLRQMWLRTMRGQGGIAVISGEAGIGKSRLVIELAAIAAARGGSVVEGAATFPEAMPYQAVVAALRRALPSIRNAALDPTWLAAAADVLPDLRDGDASVLRLSALDPERQQDRLFEALWRCFEAVARVRPLLLVFEDVHWAGPATIDFLAYLARRTRDRSVLIVATCRDDEGDASRPLRVLRQALRRSGVYTALPLDGISAGDVAFVLETVLAGPDEGGSFAKRTHELCCGNPFFLAEIVRDCLAAPALSEPVLPPSLAASIDARVAGLSADAQSLAQVAAVVGRAFTAEIIGAAAGVSEGAAAHAVDEMLDARLVRAASSEAERGAEDFAFAHDLIRARLYDRIPAALCRRLHRRVGFVLESAHGDEYAALAIELARHFDNGGEPEKATAAYVASARQALRLYADGEALAALSRGIALTNDPELRYEALALREAVHARAGRRPEQLADLDELETLAARSDQEERCLDCVRRRIMYARAIDDVDGQHLRIDALRTLVATRERGPWHAFCDEASATLMTALGRYDDASCLARDAVLTYTEASDEGGVVRCLCLIADICTLRVDPSAAQLALDDATAIALASSNETSIVRALAASALAAYMALDFDRARTSAERGREICRTIGDRAGEADFLFRLGNIAGRHFAVADAAAMYGSAGTIYEALNKPLGQAIVLINTGLLSLKIGQHVRALEALKGARAVFLELNDLRGLTICAINLGMAAYLRGRFGAALRLSRKAVGLAERLGNPQLQCSALSNVGAAERELGSYAAALSHSEAALEQRRRMAPMDIGSDLADIGLTYLRAGEIAKASAIALEIENLPPAALESVMFPQNVLWCAAQIYDAASRPDAYVRALRRAVELYEARRTKIPDGPWRAGYALLAFNRSLRRAAKAAHSDGFRTPH